MSREAGAPRSGDRTPTGGGGARRAALGSDPRGGGAGDATVHAVRARGIEPATGRIWSGGRHGGSRLYCYRTQPRLMEAVK
jgi:hypothetical protein